MALESVHSEVEATLARVKSKHRELGPALKKAHGYAVFPAVGRASAVLGGTHGRGEVFEHGELVGYATMSQATVGIQLGGQTFSEIVIFNSKEALYRFKRGRVAFTAQASVALLKAGACAVSDYEKDVVTRGFSQGGMLLELALGFQRFTYRSVQEESLREEPTKAAKQAEARHEPEEEAEEGDGRAEAQRAERETEEGDGGARDEEEEEWRPSRPRAWVGAAASRLGNVSSRLADRMLGGTQA
jgi:hypothetical protein